MAQRGDVFALTDRERITITTSAADSGGELVEATGEWEPTGQKPPPHFHPSQDEHFEVSEGELTVRLGAETRVLHAGDVLDIPRGTTHAMWNSGTVTARATWQVRPALRTEDFWKSMNDYREAGYTQKSGLIDLPAAALLFGAHRDEIRLKMSPIATRVLLPLLAVYGRLRGYPAPGSS